MVNNRNKIKHFAIDIIADKTVDEKVLQALRNKINLASVVLQENVTDWIVWRKNGPE